MSEPSSPYDRLARVYEVWVDRYARELDPMRDFYVGELLASDSPVAELGVGNGRILISVAKAGKHIIGVDHSAEMLALCRRNADEGGVAERIELLQADFRDFVLREPAALVTIPYEAIGHLLTIEDKRACLENVYRQLRPGGRLIMDQRNYDPDLAASENGLDRLAFTYDDPATGVPVHFWLHSDHEIDQQRWTTRCWLEWTESSGVTHKEELGELASSNMDAEAMGALIESSGFWIDECLGDFEDRGAMGDTSDQQIWIAHRPEKG